MSVELKFFDWNQPLLPQVATYVVDQYELKERVSMKGVVCVLPGRRAGRRFFELLVLEAAKKDKALIPPEIISQGMFPEALCAVSPVYASKQQLAQVWRRVLSECADVFQALTNNEEGDTSAQLMSVDLMNLWESVGRGGYTFSGVCKSLESSLVTENVKERWSLLSELEQVYRQQLEKTGLLDRTLYRQALLHEQRATAVTSDSFFLIGAIDLAPEAQIFIRTIDAHIVSCLSTSEEHQKEGFSEIGVLRHGYWLKQWKDGRLPVPELQVASDPFSEASIVAKQVVSVSHGAGETITIGIGDEALGPYVSTTLSACNIPSHSAITLSDVAREIVIFFSLLQEVIQEKTYHALQQFLRLPITRELCGIDAEVSVLNMVDAFGEESCPHVIFPLSSRTLPAISPAMIQVLESVEKMSAFFDRSATELEWIEIIEHWKDTYGKQASVDSQEVLVDIVREWQDSCAITSEDHEILISGGEICEALSQHAQMQRGIGSSQQSEQTVEVIGWLELLLDDSEHAVVMGMHDAAIPGYQAEDVWLPQSMRHVLEVADEAQRLGRDIYVLQFLQASRRSLVCTFAKRNTRGDFYKPSRICLGADNNQTRAMIRRSYLEPGKDERVKLFGEHFGESTPWHYATPPRLTEEIDELSVTSFRDYLACPFRFYLKQIVKLRTQSDLPDELRAPQYGNLIHTIVQRFGESPCRDSESAEEIQTFLLQQLKRESNRLFGDIATAAVGVQLYFMRNRLLAFAEEQANWRQQGWRIQHTELSIPKRSVSLIHENGKTFIRGRIDRVDVHEETGEVVAFDYKTSTWSPDPMAHYDDQAGDWVDLQLPLYQEALTQMQIGTDIRSGYIVLPASPEDTAFILSDWKEAELQSAIACAKKVASAVMQGAFWPPTEFEKMKFDDFGDLLGYGQYASLLMANEGDG